MKRLSEILSVSFPTAKVDVDQAGDLAYDNMVATWGGSPHSPLSVLLVHLRYLTFVHQTHHWISKGDNFYGDHLLFERMYNKVVEEVDQVAEKILGLCDEANVNVTLQVAQLAELMKSYAAPSTIPSTNDLARRSLNAEHEFLKVISLTMDRLKEQGAGSTGVMNMLEQMFDDHESHVYLLKRRCMNSVND